MSKRSISNSISARQAPGATPSTSHSVEDLGLIILSKPTMASLESAADRVLSAIERIVTKEAKNSRATSKPHKRYPIYEGREKPYLTPAELAVLKPVMRGDTNTEIAKMLKVTIRSVEHRLQSMFRKTGRKDRKGLIEVIRESGMFWCFRANEIFSRAA